MQNETTVSKVIRHSSDIREIEPFPLISIQKYYFLPEYARALRKFYTEQWTSVNRETVREKDFDDSDEVIGTEIGKIG